MEHTASSTELEYLHSRQRELAGLVQMKNSTEMLVAHLSNISNKMEDLNTSMSVMGKVLKNWEKVFGHMKEVDHPACYVRRQLQKPIADE
eukprot:CAMPEP_0170179912 /NCGR_PEP_ID=MMETSP0040_2-20121228/19795_1 /TAXON_ID=641309 /ORGANISM="Lotharella oceanica, Strain CCMP622" /LENGTH=89 /DNA_ID=CAMNT_0010424289 /DNA_START=63 /DNA_END=332 /DNA_ORIENTATION=+